MSVLLLQLAAPLQAWGASARFARRTSEQVPTKSGVVGLLAACQGRKRDDDVSDLAALYFGVRVDQPGTRVRDYQTATHMDTEKAMPVSQRFYVADAVFVAAVGGDDGLVQELYRAVRAPVFMPYLGRRSCPPSRPLALGVRPGTDVRQVLRREQWHASDWYKRRRCREEQVHLQVFLDSRGTDSASDAVRDQPLSFDVRHRRYGLRSVTTETVSVANPCATASHDPMKALPEDD